MSRCAAADIMKIGERSTVGCPLCEGLRRASFPSRLMTTEYFNNQASAGPRTEDNLRRIFSE
jgi:hypothetical protein